MVAPRAKKYRCGGGDPEAPLSWQTCSFVHAYAQTTTFTDAETVLWDLLEPPVPTAVYAAPAPVTEYVTPAPTPVIEHIAPAPAVTYTAPAPVIKHVSFAPDDTYAALAPVAPSPVIKYIAPARVAPGSQLPRVNLDFSGLVNPSFSTISVEASTSKVASVSLAHLEQTVAGEVIERSQEQTVLERIEKQIGDIPVPPFVEDTVEVVQSIPQERLQQHTVDQEQIIAEETTLNIASFQLVQEQVKVQENPEVQTIERIHKQIVPARIEEQIGGRHLIPACSMDSGRPSSVLARLTSTPSRSNSSMTSSK